MATLHDVLNLEDAESEKVNEGIKALFELDADTDLKAKTDLSPDDIKHLTRIKLIAEYFEIDFLNSFCDNYCTFLISKNREGRKEVVDITRPQERVETKTHSLFQKLFKR